MKKSIWIFLLAVLLPGFVLGWLALRSAEEQQIIFERRTAELYQKETEALSATAREAVESERRAFGDMVHRLLARSDAQALARDFTNSLMDAWPRKAIGFVLGPEGQMLSPSTSMAAKNGEWREFLWNNGSFLCSTQPAVVYPVPVETTKSLAYGQALKARSTVANDGKPALTVGRDADQTVLAQKGAADSQQRQQVFVKTPIHPDSYNQGTARGSVSQDELAKQIRDSSAPANQVQMQTDAPRANTADPSQQQVAEIQLPDQTKASTQTAAGAAQAERGIAPQLRMQKEKPEPTAAADRKLSANRPSAEKPDSSPTQQPAAPQEARPFPPPSAAPAAPTDALPPPAPAAAPVPAPTGPEAVRRAIVPAAPAPLSPAAPVAEVGKPMPAPKAKTEDPTAQTATAPSPNDPNARPLQMETRGRAERLEGAAGQQQQTPKEDFSATTTAPEKERQRRVQTAVASAPAGGLAGSAPAQNSGIEADPKLGTQNSYFFQTNSDVFNRKVEPQRQSSSAASNWSAILPATADFRALTANSDEGMLARFVQDKLDLIFWIRPPEAPEMVFGCLIEAGDLESLWKDLFANRVEENRTERPAFVLALLNDKAKPVATFPASVDKNRDWKRPFVASEVGEVLPHWEAALYLATPTAIADTARGLRRTLGFTIAGAIALIAIGGWLVVADVRRQLALAQQKTDFVSNVSHELKTPLTSIRMFAELMHDRPPPPEKQGQYLRIITVEAERLTRLINNVLDFAKLERRQKRFDKKTLDLCEVITRVWEGQEMHLKDAGFQTNWEAAAGPYPVLGDEDALAQILVNLLSNAEKYSRERKEVELVTWMERDCIHVSVLDRGMGVPDGEERKIFEAFYRAHDSLSSGIQGSGLGLTLAQRLAREHGGEIIFERRKDGGSRFTLRLPLVNGHTTETCRGENSENPEATA